MNTVKNLKLEIRMTENWKQILTAAVIVPMLVGCSKFSPMTKGDGSSSLASIGTPTAPVPTTVGGVITDPANIPVKPNTKTTSTVSLNSTLQSLTACSGIGTPSARAVTTFENKKGALSLEGSPTDTTAPMLNAIIVTSGEICRDLLDKEKALAAANRRIFSSVDFTRGPASVTPAVMADVVRKISRSCWGRNESAAELTMIQSDVTASFQGLTAVADTDRMMLYSCTGMLSALDSIEN